MSIKHKFTSAKSDGPDSSLVRPSNWNDEHDVIVTLTNKSGVTLAAGDVCVQDTATAEGVVKTTTQGDQRLVFVATESINNNAAGKFYRLDLVAAVAVQNTVAIGQWLRCAVTSGKAEGIPIRTGSQYHKQGLPAGAFGIALTAFAGPGAGTVKALLFGHTVAPIGYLGPTVPAAATLAVDPSATVVKVNGMTPISTITGRYPGQLLTLVFTEPGFVNAASGDIILNGDANANMSSLFGEGEVLTLICTGDAGVNTHHELSRSARNPGGRYLINENFSRWLVFNTTAGLGDVLWKACSGLAFGVALDAGGGGQVTLTGPEAAVLSDDGGTVGSKIFTDQSKVIFQCKQSQGNGTAGNRRFGLGSETALANYYSGELDDGVYFRHAVTANIFAVCRASNVETAVDTGIGASTGVEYAFAIALVSGVAYFFIDGVLKATINSNVPTAAMTVFWGSSGGTMKMRYVRAEGLK